MKEVQVFYRRMVGYSLGGTVLLILLGYWLVLFTYPNLFYQLGTQDLPFAMGAIIDGTLGLAGSVIGGSQVALMGILRTPLMIALPLMMWLLVGATAIRAIRSRSWRPLWTVGINLSLGIAAFPILSWAVQIILWAISLGIKILVWVSSLFASAQGVVGVVGGVILAVVVGGGLIAVVVWSHKARWVVGGLVVVVGLSYLFREPLSDFLGPVWAWLGSAIVVVASIVGTVFSWLLRLFVVLVVWVVAVAVLALLGSTMLTPLRDAARSGRQIDRFADVAAGVGVAVSTIITASVYNPSFGRFVAETTEQRMSVPVVGMLPDVADLSFASIMPRGFEEFFVMLFKGFNGTPDLLVVVVACAIGILALAFTAGRYSPTQGQPTIVTLGFLRVIVAMALILIVLWFTSFNSD